MIIFVLLLNIVEILCLEHIWHPYHHDPIHQSREELIITNITSFDFKLDHVVSKWKNVHVDDLCFLAGMTESNIVVAVVRLNEKKDGFVHTSFVIDVDTKPVDIALFDFWNISSQTTEAMAVVATQDSRLLWYRLSSEKSWLFWSWPLGKTIKHVNVFQIQYDYHLLVIEQYLHQTTASLYEFVPNNSPDFWLRQTLNLSERASSSAAVTVGVDTFLAIPQTSIQSLQVYQFRDFHFVPFKNLTSPNITEVVGFRIGQKAFLAFNGLEAGIYRFSHNQKDLIREKINESHLDSVNYWLPMSLEFDTILIAQRSLTHGGHRSFIIEIFTYNGEKFEEHEDVKCNYFGEGLGLSCLPDEEAQKGIRGSVSVFLGNTLGVVVPRRNRSSELFLFKIEVRKVVNPLLKQIQDFESRRQTIGELINIQKDRYQKVVAREAVDPSEIKTRLDLISEEIKQMEEYIEGNTGLRHFNVAVFNDIVNINHAGAFGEVQVAKINSEPAESVLQDIVLKNDVGPFRSTKSFTFLEVDNLTVDKINSVPSSDFLYTDNVTILGDLFLTKPLQVTHMKAQEVNGLVFEDEVVYVDDSEIDHLEFGNLEISGDVRVEKINNRDVGVYEEFFIPRNVVVVNINGQNFNEFLMGLCFRNIDNQIVGSVNVIGNVTVLEEATVKKVNGLEFPREYVFIHKTLPNITGVKHFATLSTFELLTDGTIDNISISNLITLTTPQHIPGTTTFKNLKITESLEVKGNITGKHASKFLPNPTLLETSSIKSNVQFQNLEVQGVIMVLQDFNGKNLEHELSDIIYVNEEKATIGAIKQFPEGFTTKNLLVGSRRVNDISLDAVVTKNTDQTLDLTKIEGDVTFASVEVDGMYNEVDVEKLDEEVVKVVGEQYISANLIFEDEVDVQNLEVIASMGRFSVNLNRKNFDKIIVEGNFFGEIESFDLDDFKSKRMSFTEDQRVESSFVLDTAKVAALEAKNINNVGSKEFKEESWLKQLQRKLINGQLEIKNLHIGGSVEIDTINEELCNFAGTFWTHEMEKHRNLTFNSDVSFESIEIEKLSGVNFNKFLNNIVFRNESEVTITGRKTFLKGLNVTKLIETQRLNNISLPDILTRHGDQELRGPVTILGHVVFDNTVTVLQNLNNISIEHFLESYGVTNSSFKVIGDVLFQRMPHIRNLQIQGFVEDRKAQEIIDTIVYVDEDFKLKGLVTFENNLDFDKNVRVNGKINGVDLPAFVSDMVMITKDTTIMSNVKFTEEVVVEKKISLKGNLTSRGLNGVDVKRWESEAVFIDQGFLRGTYMFNDVTLSGNLMTDQINNIDVKTLIPLRTTQELPELSFTEVSLFKDVEVGNSTNFRNLPQELENSVLTNTNQDIDSDLEFHGDVFVEKDLQLSGTLNGVDTKRIVTTDSDQALDAVYNFKSKTSLEEALLVEGLVNGIDVESWGQEVVRTSSKSGQNITDNWVIQDKLILEDDSIGDSQINGIDFTEFNTEIEEKRSYKYQIERGFIDDYTNICKDLTYMYDRVKQQTYKFDFLEELQVLNFQRRVSYVYNYHYQKHEYLLANEKKNCLTYLFVYDTKFRFVKDIHLGHVAQIISMKLEDFLFLVVRNEDFYSDCKVQGTKIWQVNEDGLQDIAVIEPQELLQESLEPGTFYGVKNHVITEFKFSLKLVIVQKYRQWTINEDNIAFVPRGLATGLALRTGRKLIKLHRDASVVNDFSLDVEEILVGNYSEEFNNYFPGRRGGNLVAMKAGIRSNRRRLLVVASHEETSIKGSLDFIKIYEDAVSGKIFQKVPSYNPGSLVNFELNNGETLLIFLEDGKALQVYEYKGIEGFKHKLSAKLQGSQLFTFTLDSKRQILGVVDRKKITLLEVVMMGNQIEENLHCSL